MVVMVNMSMEAVPIRPIVLEVELFRREKVKEAALAKEDNSNSWIGLSWVARSDTLHVPTRA